MAQTTTATSAVDATVEVSINGTVWIDISGTANTTLDTLYAALADAQKVQYRLWLRQDEAAEARIGRSIERLSAEIEAIERSRPRDVL